MLGEIGRGLNVLGGSGDDEIALGIGSSVARDVLLNLGSGDSDVEIGGEIGRGLTVTGAGDDDTVEVLAEAIIAQRQAVVGRRR